VERSAPVPLVGEELWNVTVLLRFPRRLALTPRRARDDEVSAISVRSGQFFVEERRHVIERDVLVEIGLADTLHQQEGQGAGVHLLVVQHVFDQRTSVAVEFQRGEPRGQPDSADMARDMLGAGLRHQAAARRIARRQHHAERDALAMQQARGKAGFGLKRMAESMAEVEQGALPGRFELVLRHDARLAGYGVGHRIFAKLAVARDHRGGIGIAPGEEVGIVDQAVLHHFGIARQQVALGKRFQRRKVGQHQRGLVEGADQVLACGRIDRGLAADAGIEPGPEASWAPGRTCIRASSTEAQKPVRSPITPPPSAITLSPR
ncbi:hypothetical protein COLO4_01472, partial [Corchorus olitorius]